MKLSFCHKAVILSLSKLNIKSKNNFTKIAQFGINFENEAYKVTVELSFGLKVIILSLSKLNIESKTYFTKVVQVNILFEIIT